MTAATRNLAVACGMYAFSAQLQAAWQALFAALPGFLSASGLSGYENRSVTVSFRTDPAAYRDPNLLLGHTCGYPYLKKWAATHRPVCVPMFAVAGCAGAQYSSWFITPAASTVTDLASARGQAVAVSEELSNSGMNVLRHAIAQLCGGEQFFSKVVISGSHLRSLDLIASGRIALAAIDAATFALQMAHQPALQNHIRIIGQSTHTTTPPFIAPTTIATTDHPAITQALNKCLDALDKNHRNALQLTGFQQVSADEYASLETLEQSAQAQGYPQIV